MAKSAFAGIEGASVSKGGIYFKPGNFLLKIKKAELGTSRPPKSEVFFVSEFEIVESDNPERPEGSSMSQMYMRRFDSFLGNVKGFCCAALGVAENELSAADVDEIVGETQPLEGTLIRATAFEVTTQAGKPFTKVSWDHVPNQ